MDMAVRMYFGKLSTDTELSALIDRFKDAEPGTLITHEQIEAAVGEKRTKGRYRTIVCRFKKTMLAEFNKELKARHGEGYVVLTPSDRVSHAIHSSSSIHRQIRKTHFRAMMIPRTDLSQEDTRKADHVQMVMSRMNDDLTLARKSIAPPSPSRRIK